MTNDIRIGPQKIGWWWIVVSCAVLLAVRKPWALHTPQLWAEDGSVFLVQNEQAGARAWLQPYNGYLHLLPRIIAWTASHVADPAWWPAIYNGFAFLASAGLFVRMASKRLKVPAKPWLALSFVVVASSGEAFINVTNLQWMTAFFLVLQLFFDRPTTWAQRAGDLVITVAVGLTGPFAVLLLPLFAWRWWRERHRDNLIFLLVVSACAAVQLASLQQSDLSDTSITEKFHAANLVAVLGSRLVIWPIFGPAAVRALPPTAYAILGGLAIVSLLVWVLRPHARRLLRVQVALLLLVVLSASIYRVRADTWWPHDMTNGDRYFYIPRVLFAWLLIWEFDAAPRLVALLARALAVLSIVGQVPAFSVPAPPDYRWAENCDPIRRGVPAKIAILPEGWTLEYPGRASKP